MLHRILSGDPLLRIILQHLLEQIYQLRVLVLDVILRVAALVAWKPVDEFQGIRVLNRLHLGFVGLPKFLDDELDLLDVVLSREEHLPGNELSNRAAK